MFVIKARQCASQALCVLCGCGVCVCMVVSGGGLACYGPGFTNLVHIDSSCY